MSNKSCICFVGNPGVGKSTLLSTFLGQPGIFQSGVSYGAGMTQKIQVHEEAGFYLADSPGLSDVDLRELAAREITHLFRSQKRVSLVFVVVLDGGRVRPEDVATIVTILKSLQNAVPNKDLTDQFSIIVNKVTKRVLLDINNNPETKMLIAASFNELSPFKTTRILYLNKLNELEDMDNAVADPAIIRPFLLDCPTVPVDGDLVENIDVSTIDEIKSRAQEALDQLLKANNTEIIEMEQQLQQIVAQNNLRDAAIQQEFLDKIEATKQEERRIKEEYAMLTEQYHSEDATPSSMNAQSETDRLQQRIAELEEQLRIERRERLALEELLNTQSISPVGQTIVQVESESVHITVVTGHK